MAGTSQRERITRYIHETYGTQAECLWADSPSNAIFRHPASKKWYAAIGFLPAYHMNKNHWISIVLDNSVSDDQIIPLLELSYDCVAPKRRKKSSQPVEA